jgi:hypothetical protein
VTSQTAVSIPVCHTSETDWLVCQPGVLTIGVPDACGGDGLIITFRLEGAKVRFYVNVGAAEHAQLRINSRLARNRTKLRTHYYVPDMQICKIENRNAKGFERIRVTGKRKYHRQDCGHAFHARDGRGLPRGASRHSGNPAFELSAQ